MCSLRRRTSPPSYLLGNTGWPMSMPSLRRSPGGYRGKTFNLAGKHSKRARSEEKRSKLLWLMPGEGGSPVIAHGWMTPATRMRVAPGSGSWILGSPTMGWRCSSRRSAGEFRTIQLIGPAASRFPVPIRSEAGGRRIESTWHQTMQPNKKSSDPFHRREQELAFDLLDD
jgi:hypothetical protein